MRKRMGRESTEVEKVENEVGMVENEVGGEEEARRRRGGRRTRRVHNVEPQAELALASTAGKPGKIILIFFLFSFSLRGTAGNPEIDDYVYSVNCT